MSPDISERSLEDVIECGLLRTGPDTCPGEPAVIGETPSTYGDAPPRGYHRRKPGNTTAPSGLLPRDVVDFVLATQPREWQKLP
jgi:hypothetical protein